MSNACVLESREASSPREKATPQTDMKLQSYVGYQDKTHSPWRSHQDKDFKAVGHIMEKQSA